MQDIIQLLKEEVSGRRLYQSVKEVSSYHRIQASTGYREAAKHCADYLTSLGIDTKILQYTTNGKNFVDTYKLFQEWHCEAAECHLTYPIQKKLADFKLEPLSIIQKSCSYDFRNEPLEVIHMNRGHDVDAYDDINFKDKLVFIHEHFDQYRWVLNKGAKGFISDFLNEVPHVRTRADLYDSLNYTSFWWKQTPQELPAFGYVLSPRMGDELSSLCDELAQQYAQKEAESPYPKVMGYMDTKLFDGNIDVVEATIPGIEEETILICAHLCHPCASANDNASGVAGGMEVMRTIKKLLDEHKLEALQKTIKLILIPEFTGTYLYLADGRDLTKYLCGINLDMIGGRQQDGYGPITITNLPHACPSFVDDFANLIVRKVKEHAISRHDMQLSMVNTMDEPFILGSDHFILSDPQISIPCIMIGQWPDKHYHTSTDTLEKIDTNVLRFSTICTASYVYLISNFKEDYKQALFNQMRLQYVKEMNRIEESNRNQKDYAYKHIHEFYKNSLFSLEDFCELTDEEFENYEAIYDMYAKDIEDKFDAFTGDVLHRTFKMPIADMIDVFNGDEKKIKIYQAYLKQHPEMEKNHCLLQSLSDYYIDGVRTVEEIAHEVIAEGGYGDPEDIIAYLMMMKAVELVK